MRAPWPVTRTVTLPVTATPSGLTTLMATLARVSLRMTLVGLVVTVRLTGPFATGAVSADVAVASAKPSADAVTRTEIRLPTWAPVSFSVDAVALAIGAPLASH